MLSWMDYSSEKPKINEDKKRRKYGMHKGHYKWDLAKEWFCMSNDMFFRMYGFNFVPRGQLYDEVREYVHS